VRAGRERAALAKVRRPRGCRTGRLRVGAAGGRSAAASQPSQPPTPVALGPDPALNWADAARGSAGDAHVQGTVRRRNGRSEPAAGRPSMSLGLRSGAMRRPRRRARTVAGTAAGGAVRHRRHGSRRGREQRREGHRPDPHARPRAAPVPVTTRQRLYTTAQSSPFAASASTGAAAPDARRRVTATPPAPSPAPALARTRSARAEMSAFPPLAPVPIPRRALLRTPAAARRCHARRGAPARRSTACPAHTPSAGAPHAAPSRMAESSS
jgi:hypothetical protein